MMEQNRIPSGAIRMAAALAVLLFARAQATEYPTAPEENLAIIRVTHRDAGDLARVAEDILNQTLSPEERARGIITVDPGLNAIIIRAGGPGATWPSTVRGIVRELDKPLDGAILQISLWRKGWAAQAPQTPEAKALAQAVLGDSPGEQLDAYRAPIEQGAFAGAWLNCPPEGPFRVVGVVGPVAAGGRSAKMSPIRVEVLGAAPSSGPGVMPGAPGAGAGAGAGAMGQPGASMAVSSAPGQAESASAGAAAAKSQASAVSRELAVKDAAKDAAAKSTNPAAEAAGAPASEGGQAKAEPPAPDAPGESEMEAPGAAMLPPPYGEVVFAGPLNLPEGRPAVIGPFTAEDHRGQFLIAVEIISNPGGAPAAPKSAK